MARPSKPSVKTGSFKQKSAAKKALRTAGMRAKVGKGMYSNTGEYKNSQSSYITYGGSPTSRAISAGESMTKAQKQAKEAGLSPKKTAKNVRIGMKAMEKRLAANTKKSDKMGRTYKNAGPKYGK
jgi:hypothetical protein